VREAERYCRAAADRLWLDPAAWESAARHSISEGARQKGVRPWFPDGETLARAMGVQVPAVRRWSQ
jgi:hypothetical protein